MEEILYNEINLLKNAIANLTDETGYNFCFGCYGFGKSEEYKISSCIVCKENICNICDIINTFCLFDSNVCNDCYTILSQESTLLFKIYGISFDETLINQLEDIIDQLDLHLNNCEYDESEISLLNVVDNDSIYLICCITNYQTDIVDELQTYLCDNDTFPLISNSETINVNLEILV